ncbi:hypothetical protein LMG23992_01003 [Cupriavidus laharis]|uniref:Fumarylacetoacetase N-terminal domain-containing protein n=1 Tax=Cupriavidus laharis TaxID=151654 RepID=A0ABM8WL04_9BURK|nr:hypothetical protein LMG23992_01003 [Cupriavidus laharis]
MSTLNATLDPQLTSWVASANDVGSDFLIQNLPFGRFRTSGGEGWRIGVAIGDQVFDLRQAAPGRSACRAPSSTCFMLFDNVKATEPTTPAGCNNSRSPFCLCARRLAQAKVQESRQEPVVRR